MHFGWYEAGETSDGSALSTRLQKATINRNSPPRLASNFRVQSERVRSGLGMTMLSFSTGYWVSFQFVLELNDVNFSMWEVSSQRRERFIFYLGKELSKQFARFFVVAMNDDRMKNLQSKGFSLLPSFEGLTLWLFYWIGKVSANLSVWLRRERRSYQFHQIYFAFIAPSFRLSHHYF